MTDEEVSQRLDLVIDLLLDPDINVRDILTIEEFYEVTHDAPEA